MSKDLEGRGVMICFMDLTKIVEKKIIVKLNSKGILSSVI